MGLLGTVSGCHRDRAYESFTVASVRLSCWPIARGMQCQLLALSRDVSQAPRDVTAHAAWRLSGLLGVQISPSGIIQGTADGDVDIEAVYESQRAHQMVRLAKGGSGQLLILVRGRAFAVGEGEYESQKRSEARLLIIVPLETAAIEGAVRRLRPIMMTMLVATLGLLPAALSHAIGSDSQRPFAIVIVGGLIVDLVMSTFLLPTFYVWWAGPNDHLPPAEEVVGIVE